MSRYLSFAYFVLFLGMVGETNNFFRRHAGPESENLQPPRTSFVPYYDVIRHGCVYLKYFNGTLSLDAAAPASSVSKRGWS